MRRSPTPLLWVLVLGLGSCAGSLPGLDGLREGRLPAALSELRALEPRVPRLPPGERARYALYRGLAELGLGNAAAADRWLSAAWRADAADPTCFDASEHGALMAAWRTTGRLPGEAGGRRDNGQ